MQLSIVDMDYSGHLECAVQTPSNHTHTRTHTHKWHSQSTISNPKRKRAITMKTRMRNTLRHSFSAGFRALPFSFLQFLANYAHFWLFYSLADVANATSSGPCSRASTGTGSSPRPPQARTRSRRGSTPLTFNPASPSSKPKKTITEHFLAPQETVRLTEWGSQRLQP